MSLTGPCSGLRGLLAAMAALAAAACATPDPVTYKPALVQAATPQCHAQVEHAIAGMLGAPVTLLPDVFTQQPVVTVDKPMPRDAQGLPLDGRLTGMPPAFRLLTDGAQCLVARADASATAAVPGCTCFIDPRQQADRTR